VRPHARTSESPAAASGRGAFAFAGELARGLATHGPECWWEAADSTLRALPKRYVLGYRPEYWPRQEAELGAMLERAGLAHVRTQRLRWQDTFASGAEAHAMFAAASASWWLTRVPPHAVAAVDRRTRDYFQRRGVSRITQDILLAYGLKR